MKNNLLDETLELARTSSITITRLCSEIDVSPEWYHKLMAGKIKDPGVRRIQRLHDYLAERSSTAMKPAPVNEQRGAE